MSKTIWALLNSKMGCRMGWFAGSRIHGSWVMGRPKRHIYKVYGSDFYSFFQTPFSLFSSYYPRSLSSQSSSPMRMGGSRRRLPAGGGGAAAGNPFFLIFFWFSICFLSLYPISNLNVTKTENLHLDLQKEENFIPLLLKCFGLVWLTLVQFCSRQLGRAQLRDVPVLWCLRPI